MESLGTVSTCEQFATALDSPYGSGGGLHARLSRRTGEAGCSQPWAVKEGRRTSDVTAGFHQLLRGLLESAMGVVGAKRGFVLVEGLDGIIRAEVTADVTRHPPRSERRGAGPRSARQALQAVCLLDSAEPSGAWPSGGGSAMEMHGGVAVGVPLRVEGRTAGLLYLDGRRPSRASTELDLHMVEALAEHAALALAAARLDERILTLLERLRAVGLAPGAGPPERRPASAALVRDDTPPQLAEARSMR